MSLPPLQLPIIQNWSCHSCGGCCRQHLIEITEEERQRIAGQNWTAADGIPADPPPVVWFAGPPWKKRYRLAHRADGACVFLNEQGLCRIHAKFGEAAKPLPCQLYPYAFHPGGRKVAVSLRFSCPSVVANRGKPVELQRDALKVLEAQVVPAHAETIAPPPISPRARVDWPDFHRFVQAIDEVIAQPELPLPSRLLQAVSLVRTIGQAKFDAIQGNRLVEFLQIVSGAVRAEPVSLENGDLPTRAGRLQFRMLAAHYARRDTFEEVARGWRGRLRLLRAALTFARGRGSATPLQPAFREVPFATLEESFGGLSPEMDSMLTRYFRVKIQGLHFCGPAYYDVPFVEGFYSLALVFPVVMWLARWLAASQSRNSLVTDDVAGALAIADHHHGYSPVLGSRSSRRRVRLLTHDADLERLIIWYAR
jgi:lysine-N-methylase